MVHYVLHEGIYYNANAGSVSAPDANPEYYWVLANPPNSEGEAKFPSPNGLFNFVASILDKSDNIGTIPSERGYFVTKLPKDVNTLKEGTLIGVIDKPFDGIGFIEKIQAQAAKRWKGEQI
ncbi:MAG: hypothetical protein Q8R04_01730 [Nanoarchaeota archaeon]|nr:hypothetical protein [Nanoarchaeota archaeon]